MDMRHLSVRLDTSTILVVFTLERRRRESEGATEGIDMISIVLYSIFAIHMFIIPVNDHHMLFTDALMHES
jgi:hypothetical protein